jgi:hypothetical protein
MFSTISALEIARQHSKVSHDSNNSKSPDITKFGHFGVPCTMLHVLVINALIHNDISTAVMYCETCRLAAFTRTQNQMDNNIIANMICSAT